MTSVSSVEDLELFDKALIALNGAPPDTLTTSTTNDNDSKKLADDAIQVSLSFDTSSDQLAVVDSENPGRNWKGQWDPLGQVGSLPVRTHND